MSGTILCFELDYFDAISKARIPMWLKFYVDEGSIEVRETEKIFLKRINYPDISLRDLVQGNSITIFNRIVVVKSYSNAATVKYMKQRELRILCVIRNEGVYSLPQLLRATTKYGLAIGRMLSISKRDETQSIDEGDIAVELIGLSANETGFFSDESICSLRSSSRICRSTFEEISQVMSHQCFVSRFDACSLCLVKPHVYNSSLASILGDILDGGFKIVSLASLHLSPSMAEELLGAYKDIVPRYGEMLAHITAGTSLAIAVSGFEADTVVEMRKLCGPYVPTIAKALRSNSLRAKYGSSAAHNVIHCSDAEEFGGPECRFIFGKCKGE